MKYQFQMSVVIPLFNVEKYISQAIDSVIEQSIGLSEIQIILVNDGSTDNTKSICEEYQSKYSKNITLINQDNHGVSHAKNTGIEHATGKYIHFLDGDDKIDTDAYEKVIDMFEANYDLIDTVDLRIKNFGAREGYTVMDWIFTENRMVDLTKEPESIKRAAASSIYKTESIKELRFDESMVVFEDGKFINTVLLKSLKYGIIADSCYYYRRREDESSITQSQSRQSKEYYKIINTFLEFCENSKELYGEVIPYIQYSVIYHLDYCIRHWAKGALETITKQDKDYLKNIKTLASILDEELIMNAKHSLIDENNRFVIMCLKKDNPNLKFTQDGEYIAFDGHRFKKTDSEKIKILKLKIDGSHLYWELVHSTYLVDSDIRFQLNGKDKQIIKLNHEQVVVKTEQNKIVDFEVPITKIVKISGMIDVDNHETINILLNIEGQNTPKKLIYGYLAKLFGNGSGFYRSGNYIVRQNNDKTGLLISKEKIGQIIKKEVNGLRTLYRESSNFKITVMYLLCIFLKRKTPRHYVMFGELNNNDITSKNMGLTSEQILKLKHYSFDFENKINSIRCNDIYINSKLIVADKGITRNYKLNSEYNEYFKRFFDFDAVILK